MPPVKKVKANKKAKAVAEAVKPADETVISGQLSKKMLRERKRQMKKERGVVFIKHLPHGFFEEQLKKYFQQFGTVTRLRLVRSRRTGGSKGYAFIEFEYPEVAQVAAETMDNYLMFQKLVKAAYIPPEKQLYNYFKTSVRKVTNKAGKEIIVSNKTASIKRQVDRYNDWSEDITHKRTEANLRKIKKLNEKYAHLGIDFSTICFKPDVVAKDESIDVEEEGAEAEKESENEKLSAKKDKLAAKNKAKDVSSIKNKVKLKVDLADLLGSSIKDDSEDDDWEQDEDDSMSVNSDNESEDYSIVDDDDNSNEEEEADDDDEDSIIEEVVQKSTKKPSYKQIKKAANNVEKIENFIKRKPQSGGITKIGKKVVKKPTPLLSNKTNKKQSMLISAAKECAKPMSKNNVKAKGAVALKKKVVKKVK